MKESYKPLLTPWKIGKVEIKNRIVLTSMGGTDLFGWMEVNHFDKDGARFILEVAKNNAGLVLPGCQPVYNPMYGQWLHKNKKMYEDLAKWMPEFHKTGAKLFVQLTAGFGRSFTISEMMEKLYTNKALRAVSKPFMDLDKITATASPSPNRWSDKVPSREMTKAEIQEFIDSFAKCAKLLQDAGVDGVEVHAVHEGYLLDQFTLHYVNKRTDEYGGSLENRYRFAAEIVKAIKAACGPDFPVSLRYSVVSKTKGFRQGALPGEDYVEAGRDMAESEIAAKFLQDAGYDMLNCDNGTYDAWYWAHPPVYMPENCNLAEVEHIKNFVDIPVVCAGRMTLEAAAKSIAEGRLDGAGFARNFLADPEWFTKVIEDREDDIRPCILCHNGCFNMCHYKGVPNDQDLSDSLHLARCAVNAEMMQWDKHYIKKTDKPKTVHIVGGGIGGMEAACEYLLGAPVGETVAVVGGGLTGCEIAYELALQGKNVSIVEMKDDLVSQKGVCLANSSYLREWFAWKKVPVYLETTLREVRDGAIVCAGKDGTAVEIPCDTVISSAGYISTPLVEEKGHKNVHLVGDCLRVGNLRSVVWRAYETAMKI